MEWYDNLLMNDLVTQMRKGEVVIDNILELLDDDDRGIICSIKYK